MKSVKGQLIAVASHPIRMAPSQLRLFFVGFTAMNDPAPQPPSEEVRTVPPAENNPTGAYVTGDGETRTFPPRETAPFTSAIPDLPPGYEFQRELGRGGMGVVYQARDTKLNRIVALKMILAGSHAAQSEMQRFLKEAEAAAAMQHVNIVQIFETGQHYGLPYFTLEFVDADILAAYAARFIALRGRNSRPNAKPSAVALPARPAFPRDTSCRPSTSFMPSAPSGMAATPAKKTCCALAIDPAWN